MMKRKYRVILLAALVLGWMGVIFMFSSQDGAASSETSGRVVKVVITVIKPDFNSLAKSEQISFRDMVTFFVRKGAHFTEYMILGVLLFLFYYEWRPKISQVPQKENTHIMQLRLRRIWFMAWITGTLYAAGDEFHQMFTGGRSPQVRRCVHRQLRSSSWMSACADGHGAHRKKICRKNAEADRKVICKSKTK